MTTKCVLILSEKSSGSSILQTLLTQLEGVHHVSHSPHHEYETLFWTKAASILCKPQIRMVDSVVPLSPDIARRDLVALLTSNLKEFAQPPDDRALIFRGWELLCHEFAPVFLEKSPHHLCQWSALELIIESTDLFPDIDVLLVGLIRNPMDTIYSQYRRWKSRPEQVERQWLTAYHNLLRLEEIVRDKLVIIRYEDLIDSTKCLHGILEFCNATEYQLRTNLHKKSLQVWRADYSFLFELSSETIKLAQQYGYRNSELVNTDRKFPRIVWPAIREFGRAKYKLTRSLKKTGAMVLRNRR